VSTGIMIWLWVSAVVLAAALYRPVKRLVFVSRVRRFERKVKRESTVEERAEIERKLVPLIAVVVVTFSFLFTRFLVMQNFVGR